MNSTDFQRLVDLHEREIACVKEIAKCQQRIISQLERGRERKDFSRKIDEMLDLPKEPNSF